MKRSIIAVCLFSLVSTTAFASVTSDKALTQVQKDDLYCAGWNQSKMEKLPEDSGDYNEALNAVNYFYMKGENDGLNDDDSTKSALMDQAWQVGYDAYNKKPYQPMPAKCIKSYGKYVQSLPDSELNN